MQQLSLISKAIDSQISHCKGLQWDDREQDWQVASGDRQWHVVPEPPKDKPSVKRFGNWNDSYYDTDGEEAVVSAFSFVAAVVGVVAGIIACETFLSDTNALIAGVVIFVLGSLIYPLMKAIPENVDYYRELSARKKISYPELELYKKRPHSTGANEGDYLTYAVDVDEESRAYQLRCYRQGERQLQTAVLASVPVSDDINQMTEAGLELARLAKKLEEEAKAKYTLTLHVDNIDRQLEDETKRSLAQDAQIMRQVVGQR